MSLIKWEPFNDLDRFFDEGVLESFPRRWGRGLATDMYEEKGSLITKMCLSGVKPEEVDISIEDDVLTVSGTREEEKEVKEKEYFSKEIRRGAFSRSVRFPKAVLAEKATATFEDGVLIVSVPVVQGATSKGVKVKINS
jgi:HSP20 family protein